MAKEEKEIPMMIKVVTGVVLFAISVFGISWSASSSSSAHAGLVSSHETRITKVETGVEAIKERLTSSEKTQIAIQKDQQAILSGQNEMKAQQLKFSEMQIKQITTIAELSAYLKTIENID